MKISRFCWGILLTFSYFIWITITVGSEYYLVPTLKLNELGDFLAGVFGPVAFLWLVLGYMQQGEELRSSSNALQKQAIELENSVRQQETIAKVAMIQLEEINRSHEADFQIMSHGKDGGQKRDISTEITIKNSGSDAGSVKMSFDPIIGGELPDIGTIKTNEFKQFRINYPKSLEDSEGCCCLSYVGRDGKKRVSFFDYHLSIGDDKSILFRKVDSGDTFT